MKNKIKIMVLFLGVVTFFALYFLLHYNYSVIEKTEEIPIVAEENPIAMEEKNNSERFRIVEDILKNSGLEENYSKDSFVIKDAFRLDRLEEVVYDDYCVEQKTEFFKEGPFAEDSKIDYPVLIMNNKEIENKINKIWYEMLTVKLPQDLSNEIYIDYSANYDIKFSNEEYISMYFSITLSRGGTANNFESAITINLETGEEIDLKSFCITQEDVYKVIQETEFYDSSEDSGSFKSI